MAEEVKEIPPSLTPDRTSLTRSETVSRKNLISLLLVGIALFVIPFGVKLVSQQQIFKSRAAEPGEVKFIKGEGVDCDDQGKCVTTGNTVQLELRSPFGPPAPFGTTQTGGGKDSLIGKGGARIELAYPDKTNLADPGVKANVEEDIRYVSSIFKDLPILGYPLVSLSAQKRYGYTFNAVNKDSVGTYNKSVNQLFLNMEEGSKKPIEAEHLIFHEMAHYLSVKYNRENLAPYLSRNAADQAEEAENNLLDQIRKYDQNPDLGASDTFSAKLESKTPVTWQEIVDAANSYPAWIWQNPKDFLQFSKTQNPDMVEVRKRADEELLAEFTSFLQQAQKAGLYDSSYQHPVYKILADVKANSS